MVQLACATRFPPRLPCCTLARRACSLRIMRAPAQNIVRAVELAGEVVEELAKVGEADAAKAQHLCSQFLQTVKVSPS